MWFYKITAELVEDYDVIGNSSGYKNAAHQVKFDAFFEKIHYTTYFFISKIDKKQIIIGCFSKKANNIEGVFIEFCEYMELEIKKQFIQEITLLAMNMLLTAACEEFIHSYSTLICNFDIVLRTHADKERLIDTTQNKEQLLQTAKMSFCADNLGKEIERIYTKSSCAGIYGHPVHYFLQIEEEEILEEWEEDPIEAFKVKNTIINTLLSALYQNNRIANKRYYIIKYSSYMITEYWEEVYRTAKGGVVIIWYPNYEENEFDAAQIADVCKLICKYRNDVLTINCASDSLKYVNNYVARGLAKLMLVTIRQEEAHIDIVKEYWKQLTIKHGLSITQELDHIYDSGIYKYDIGSAKKIFYEWFSNYLKSSIFPQYATLQNIQDTNGVIRCIDTATTDSPQQICEKSALSLKHHLLCLKKIIGEDCTDLLIVPLHLSSCENDVCICNEDNCPQQCIRYMV